MASNAVHAAHARYGGMSKKSDGSSVDFFINATSVEHGFIEQTRRTKEKKDPSEVLGWFFFYWSNINTGKIMCSGTV